MPIIDYQMRVTSRFDCPTPQAASPGAKQAHQLPRLYDVRTPHVALDALMGTRRSTVERLDHNFYQGHVPDAPVLLGPELSAQYARGAQDTGWSLKRAAAFGSAFAVGAVIGAVVVTVILGVIAGLHWLNPLLINHPTLTDWLQASIGWALGGAVLCLVSDWRDWRDANGMFRDMGEMSEVATRLRAGLPRPNDVQDADGLVAKHQGGDCWLRQQAALELDAARAAEIARKAAA